MKLKFWQREPETRESAYSDALLRIIADSVNDDPQDDATAAKEACAGLWSRAFASAEVTPQTPTTMALNGEILGMVGRNLYECGQSVFEIEVMGGQVKLCPASDWYVTGGKRWTYKLDIPHPTTIETHHRDQDAVLHLRYDTESSQPWLAVGPLNRARSTGDLLGNLEKRMGQESDLPMGNLIPAPFRDEKLEKDLQAMKGNVFLVHSTAEGWGEGTPAQQRPDYKVVRIGADFPESLETTRQGSADHVFAASGVPPALWRSDGEGTSKREAWRQFLHATVMPVAKMILPELRYKLNEPDLKLTFSELFASDLQGRARAFQSMVGGGMDVVQAAALSGLMVEES